MWFWGWFIGLWIAGVYIRRRWGLLSLKNLLERSLHVMLGIGVGCFLLTIVVALGQLSSGESPVITGLFCAGAAWLVILPALELIHRAASASRDSLQAEVARQLAARKAAGSPQHEQSAEAEQDSAEERNAVLRAEAAIKAALRPGGAETPASTGRTSKSEQKEADETFEGSTAGLRHDVEPGEDREAMLQTEPLNATTGASLAPLQARLKTRKRKPARTPAEVGSATRADSEPNSPAGPTDATLKPAHPLQRPSGPISLGRSLRSAFSTVDGPAQVSPVAPVPVSKTAPEAVDGTASSRFIYQPHLIESRLGRAFSAPAQPANLAQVLPSRVPNGVERPEKASISPKTA